MIKPPSSHLNPQQHLTELLGHDWYKIVYTIFSKTIKFTHEFFDEKGLDPTLFPITTGSISSPMGKGSDSVPVKTKIKGLPVYLADSMQFSLEIGARLGDKGAYYIMPTFRGENVDERHLNEFTHSEVEIKGSIKDAQKLAEDYILYVTKRIYEECHAEILKATNTTEHIEKFLEEGFKTIAYSDAIAELKDVQGALEQDKSIERDIISSIGEKELISRYGDFTWLTKFPWSSVPFYQSKFIGRSKKSDEIYSNTADLLAGIGEILGAGERVLTGSDIDESLKFHEVSGGGYEWYRQMHEDYNCQTSGFGLGVERYILWLLKHNDIRDVTLLLRNHEQIIFP
jgi:asparaginyl-tRNA synthetase